MNPPDDPTSLRGEWAPLIDGALRRHALGIVEEIVDALTYRSGTSDDAAITMLMAYTAQAELGSTCETLATERLDAVIASLAADGSPMTGLWGGIAGVGFLVAHLADDATAEEASAVIDGVLERELDVSRWEGDYDLIGGLVGIGVGAIERLHAAGAARIAGRVLDHLEATALEQATGLAWFTPPALLPVWQREHCPSGYYNLGLAHGMPGIAGLLASFVAAGFEEDRSRRLLSGLVAWLRAAVPPGASPRFPAWLAPGFDSPPSRLAWCYGDPGVALPLLAAARALSDDRLEAEAIAIGHAMAARSLNDCGVRDAGICHGAAGLAHLFNRMYQATRDEVLGEAARRWIAQLLAMRRPGADIAGFPALRIIDGADRWEGRDGLLDGATGVGLVLLAAATDIEPSWDRMLLVDVAPGLAV